MTTWQERQRKVLLQTANQAWGQPLLTSGFWTHGDIRNNYYLASYLIAAVADSEYELPFNRDQAMAKASDVMTRVLLLQDKDPLSATYGHWPLGLGENPVDAQKNTLPAEIMGCLLAYCYKRYRSIMPDSLCDVVEQSLEVLYRGTYYRKLQRTFGHHEAKYTASKLIFGQRFGDQQLLEIGFLDLERTLDRVREFGMPEYGALPWFWHWIQAYTSAYECLPSGEVRSRVAELLDELWNYRAVYYLSGAWSGGRMRSLSHDLPRDGNVAFDYVQFGDFELPDRLPRVEYAGLLFHQAPDEAMATALHRHEPRETKRIITSALGQDTPGLHSYLYAEKSYAAGGIWERVNEFDNEQHRWEITFPLFTDGSVNHLYVLPPGKGYTEGDPRHASECGEVLFHKGTIIALYPTKNVESQELVGVLPLGEWVQEQGSIYGRVHDVYISLFTQGTLQLTEETDRLTILCEGISNGIVVDAISDEEAGKRSITSLADFVHVMELRKPEWKVANLANAERLPILENLPNLVKSENLSYIDYSRGIPNLPNSSNTGVSYESFSGDRLWMEISLGIGRPARLINGSPVDFENYSTPGQSS